SDLAMRRAYLGAAHAEAVVVELAHVRGHDRLGEARPAAMRFELVRGREQRLPGDDVHVDARAVLVQVLPGAGALGAAFLGDVVLLRGQPGDGVGILAIGGHGRLQRGADHFAPLVVKVQPSAATAYSRASRRVMVERSRGRRVRAWRRPSAGAM